MSPTRQILIEVKADGSFEATIDRMVEQTHKFNRRAMKTARKIAKRKWRKTNGRNKL